MGFQGNIEVIAITVEDICYLRFYFIFHFFPCIFSGSVQFPFVIPFQDLYLLVTIFFFFFFPNASRMFWLRAQRYVYNIVVAVSAGIRALVGVSSCKPTSPLYSMKLARASLPLPSLFPISLPPTDLLLLYISGLRNREYPPLRCDRRFPPFCHLIWSEHTVA